MQEILRIVKSMINRDLLTATANRIDRWSNFITEQQCYSVLEIGVFRGEFAYEILKRSSLIKEYYMLDPWRNMDNSVWNATYNFAYNMENIYSEALEKTSSFSHKRRILRGTTVEKINEVKDASLDFVYVDGDHSLKGVSIDLIRSWSKVKDDGFVAGHDFKPLVWKNKVDIEPYLVFPFAIYFAEAMGVKIYGLPSNEFLIAKGEKGFEFIDLSENKRFKKQDILNQAYRLPFSYLSKIFLKKLFRR